MIKDVAINVGSGVAEKHRPVRLITAVAQTNLIADIAQIGHSFSVEKVTGYCSAEAGAVTAQVGVVRPGSVVGACVLAIGTVKDRFQITGAFLGLVPGTGNGGTPIIVSKAAEDGIEFSGNYTVNAAAAAPLVWGAFRVQMNAAGTVSTKAVTTNQSFTTEALALASCPAADTDKINLGTITVQTKASQTFTANTTNLDDATAVNATNYNPADGFVSVTSAAVAFAAGTVALPTMVSGVENRGVSQGGGLLVTRYTSDGTGALTQGVVDIRYRPWPLNTEVGGA